MHEACCAAGAGVRPASSRDRFGRQIGPRQTQGSTPMREDTPLTITDAVLEQMAETPDARMKEVMEAAVRHLHAFAREVNLTPAEWIKGIEFMTKVGQACTPAR